MSSLDRPSVSYPATKFVAVKGRKSSDEAGVVSTVLLRLVVQLSMLLMKSNEDGHKCAVYLMFPIHKQ